jgi:hypothetical protein
MRFFKAEAAHRSVNRVIESQDVGIRKSRDRIVEVPTNPGVLYTPGMSLEEHSSRKRRLNMRQELRK